MKTNSFVRGILRIRAIVLCLAIVGLVVVEVGFGQSLAARFGQYTAAQTQASQAPSLSIGDLMSVAPVLR
jgi:hypothetical protein